MHNPAGVYQEQAIAIWVEAQVNAAAFELALARVTIKTRLRMGEMYALN